MDDLAAEALLHEVVACYSPSGSEAAVANLLARRMSEHGAAAQVDAAGNAVGTWGNGPLQVTFLGHLDTVPGEIDVRVEDRDDDRYLYGRGSVDAKGSLCTAIAAAARLEPSTLARLTLRVVGAVEEEAPSSRGARHAVASLPRPDLLIVGEPSGWERYTLGYKGRMTVQLGARRATFHSAREEASAADLVVAACGAVRDWVHAQNRGSERSFDRLQLSITKLASLSDGFEDSCRATLSFRLPPHQSVADLEANLNALLLGGAGPEGGEALELEVLSAEEPQRQPNDTLIARAFRVAIRAHGGRPRPTLKTGTSDMNVVAPHWPVPMLAYGPGDSTLDHTPHEHLSLAEFRRAVAVLVTALNEVSA